VARLRGLTCGPSRFYLDHIKISQVSSHSQPKRSWHLIFSSSILTPEQPVSKLQSASAIPEMTYAVSGGKLNHTHSQLSASELFAMHRLCTYCFAMLFVTNSTCKFKETHCKLSCSVIWYTVVNLCYQILVNYILINNVLIHFILTFLHFTDLLLA